MPTLPVDSAMSCSAQAPKLAMAGEAITVTLSRPFNAAAPMAVPSSTPGFTAGGTAGPQERTMIRARSRPSFTSRPMAAAGTRPKAESTE